MPIDFSPLQRTDPAGAFFAGQQAAQQQADQNMLRQQQVEERAMRLQTLQRQREQEAKFDQMSGLISQYGLDPDDPKVLGQFAQAAMQARNPQLVSFVSEMAERAAKRRAAKEEASAIGNILSPRLPPGPPLQPNALAAPAAPVNALAAPQQDLLAGTPFAVGPMAAPAAPAPPRPAAPDNAAKIADYERQRDALEALATPRALAEAKRIDRLIEKLAPPKPAVPPADIATMRILGYPETPEGYARFKAVSKPEAPRVDVKVASFTPASEEAQKDYIKSVGEERRALRNAPDTLKNIAAAKALIPSASSFMGKGGEPLLAAASFLNNRLGFTINTQGVTDATVLRTRLFEGILDNLKKLDSQPSQEQQRVLAEALGNLGTDPAAVGQILDRIGETVRDRVGRYNTDVDEAEKRGVKFPFKPQIKLPSGLSSQDQQALDWANANPTDPRAAQIKQRLGVK